ncbi:hypothetical protein EV424DRAFT_1586805 [Suillus variegatus]|nr:hypothetical protein EV424DRAFT_1586805 [Suillus variegatus]
MCCSHISHSPALISDTASDLLQQLLLHLRWRKLLRDNNKVFYCVSSAPRAAKPFRRSSWIDHDTLLSTGGYRAAEEVRDVNHSPYSAAWWQKHGYQPINPVASPKDAHLVLGRDTGRVCPGTRPGNTHGFIMIIRVQLISPESRLGDLQTLQVATLPMSESDASPSTPTSNFELDASPAKNTCSHKRTVVSPTPVLESPTKKRRTKADVTDLDVWDKTDDEIIIDGSRDYLEFKFTCHTDPVNHKPHHRKRMQTGQGTKNLNRGITECIQRRGVSTEGPNAKGAQQTLSGSISKYTPEAHRALIAMRCAVNTPLMNDLGAVTSIMRTKMVKGPKGKASGKGKSNNIVIDSD